MIFDLIKKLFFRTPEPMSCTKSQDVRAFVFENQELACIDTEASWIGVDLDGTLAHWDDGSTLDHIGKPIPSRISLQRFHGPGSAVLLNRTSLPGHTHRDQNNTRLPP